MARQPISSDEIRAAAHVHSELGPEFSDAVVESFLERIDQEIKDRIDARLPVTPHPRARQLDPAAVAKRHAMLVGVALGAVGAGAPLTAFAYSMSDGLGRSGWLVGIWLVIAVIFGASAIGLKRRTRR
jgi:hypothetical protein